jgi:hypothetical protein
LKGKGFKKNEFQVESKISNNPFQINMHFDLSFVQNDKMSPLKSINPGEVCKFAWINAIETA